MLTGQEWIISWLNRMLNTPTLSIETVEWLRKRFQDLLHEVGSEEMEKFERDMVAHNLHMVFARPEDLLTIIHAAHSGHETGGMGIDAAVSRLTGEVERLRAQMAEREHEAMTGAPPPEMLVWARVFDYFKAGVRSVDAEMFQSPIIEIIQERSADIDEDQTVADLSHRAFTGGRPRRVLLEGDAVRCLAGPDPHSWFGWCSNGKTAIPGGKRWIFWSRPVRSPHKAMEAGWMLTTVRFAEQAIVGGHI